jgi:hypothetical protein
MHISYRLVLFFLLTPAAQEDAAISRKAVKVTGFPVASRATIEEMCHHAGHASLVAAIEAAYAKFGAVATHADGQVRKTPSWPRSWANFSVL